MTQIWSANIIIGNDTNQVILEKQAVKKLPLQVLLSDTNFIERIKLKIPVSTWKKLPIPKDSTIPRIKIFYLKRLGFTAEEPQTII